jgi:hypothetical protein
MKNLKIIYVILGCLQIFIAIGAIPAGVGYLMDTSGAKLGVTPELLEKSPLDSFLLPGLFLVLVNGLATATGGVLSFLRHRYAGLAALVLGNILILWIIIQVAWIGMISFMQPMFFVIGVIETVLGFYLYKKSKGY